MLKRVFDLTLVLVTSPLWLPLLAAVAVISRVVHGSPVLFRQVRPGYRGSRFELLKFRTMTQERDAHGVLLPDGARLTRFGRFMREASLDELPGLLNVLRGEMSLVGPRPLLVEYMELYTSEQARRHEVRPGLTGWAQVNGRNAVSWEDKFALDVWYVDNQSFWLDVRILFMTMKKVLVREGISAEGEATMSRFTGSRKANAK